MACLGWSEEQTMRADVNTVHLALERHGALLVRIFGSSEEESKPAPTYRDFKEFAQAHNAERAARREKEQAKAAAKAQQPPPKAK